MNYLSAIIDTLKWQSNENHHLHTSSEHRPNHIPKDPPPPSLPCLRNTTVARPDNYEKYKKQCRKNNYIYDNCSSIYLEGDSGTEQLFHCKNYIVDNNCTVTEFLKHLRSLNYKAKDINLFLCKEMSANYIDNTDVLVSELDKYDDSFIYMKYLNN